MCVGGGLIEVVVSWCMLLCSGGQGSAEFSERQHRAGLPVGLT